MLKHWKVIESEAILETPWFIVRQDACETAGGLLVPEYYTWQKHDCVTVFPVTEDGDVLLIRQYRHGTRQIAVDYPGGTIEPNQSVLEAAAYELAEETAFAAREYTLIGSYTMDSSYSNQRVHFVIASDCRPARSSRNPFEETEVLKVRMDAIEGFASESIDCLLCTLLTHKAMTSTIRG